MIKLLAKYHWLWKESEKNDVQQFRQFQQNEQLLHLSLLVIVQTKERPHMSMNI